MTKLGRNDPCHCGSGKKYKKCHLDSDLRGQAGAGTLSAEADAPTATVDVKRLPQIFSQLTRTGSAADRQKFSELLAETKPLIEYLDHQEAIEAAAAELELHRAEFEKLRADKDRFADFAQTVFSDESLTSLRFTASDVQHAFEQVGYPGALCPDEQTLATLRAAILRIADKERRSKLVLQLHLKLPEFVAAGRHLEAWLLQSMAFETSENNEESNLFLFHMFSFGYDALAAEKQARQESFFRELGIDLGKVKGMNLDELDALIQSCASDPAKAAELEAFYCENPHLREESVAHLEAMERRSAELLERDDSRFLLLADDEVRPWIALFHERANQSGMVSEAAKDLVSEESANKLLKELILPLMREMAGTIFTRDRILGLVADLKTYRSQRFAAGDKVTPGLVMGVITGLEREDSPGENPFLLTLCFRSLTLEIKANAAKTDCAVE